MPSSSSKTPRDFLRVAFRHRKMFLLVAALFATVSLYASQYIPKKYTGMSKFERRTDDASGINARDNDSFATVKLTLMQELAGWPALERVAKAAGLLEGIPHDEENRLTAEGELKKQDIIRKLQSDIKINWEVQSRNVDLIAVSVTRSDPLEAQELPDLLVDSYITYISEEIIKRLMNSRTFFAKSVSDSSARLTELTDKRIEFETRHAGSMPESPGALQERIQRVVSVLDTLRRQQMTAKQKLTIIRASRGPTPTTNPTSQPVEVVKGPNPKLEQLKNKLWALEAELDIAVNQRGMKEKHPTVVILKTNIAQLKIQIDKTPPEIVMKRVFGGEDKNDNLMVDEALAKSELGIVTSEIERLESRLKNLDALMVNFAPRRQEYVEMCTKIGKQENELARWQEGLATIQMKLSGEVSKHRTQLTKVQRAQEQIRPSSPSLTFILAFSMVGGLGVAGGLIFLLNMMDRSIGTTEDAIKYFDVPICGVISEIESAKCVRIKRLQRWLLYPVVTAVVLTVLVGCTANIVLRLKDPERHKVWKTAVVTFISKNLPI